MGQFVGDICLKVLPGESDNWEVCSAFDYVASDKQRIPIPDKWKTDLASIPRLFWNILPPFGLYTGAAIVHDYLYTAQVFVKSYCDSIFLEAMEAEGVSRITRYTMYYGVKFGGHFAWNAHKRERASKK